MKNFLTSMMGGLAALLVFTAGSIVVLILGVAGLAVIGDGEKAPSGFEKGSYLVVDLSTRLTDAPAPLDLTELASSRTESLQLRTVLRALRAAAKDDRIAGVYLSGDLSGASFGTGYASLREVRAALAEVRRAGKPVVAYLTYVSTKGYYVASVASELTIDPYGVIMMPGLSTEPMFFAGALEKYGVNVQVTRVGKYKSAVEPFTRRDMSPENREELQKLLGDLWSGLLSDMAPVRRLTPERLQAIVDAEGMIRAPSAREHGLVDRVAYRDEVYDLLKTRTGRAGSKEPFKQITLADYAKATRDTPEPTPAGSAPAAGTGAKGRVAIVYAEGEIVDGEGGDDEIGGSRFSRALRKLRQDDGIKAVVLRVNSPGGSASASEVIQRELRLLRKVKPVVVSMGNYAASGGYWISAYGDRIFAEPSTITGSIGVFGLQFDVQRLAGDFGITFDRVKTGRFADALTVSRPKTAEELAVLQGMVDWIYGEFVAKVAEGRKLPPARVQEIAQGRVWSGTEALAIGLVDELGGLEAALAHAARQAGLGADYHVVEYPAPKELLESIQEILERHAPGFARSTGVADRLARRLDQELRFLRAFNDPQGVYARLPLNLYLQ